MKYFLIIIPIVLSSCFGSSGSKSPGVALNNLSDSAGYALGVDVASSLQSRNMTGINRELIRYSLEEYLQGKPSLIEENECFMVLNQYSNLMAQADSIVVSDKSKKKKSKKSKKQEVTLLSLPDSAGYALGINIANSLKMQDMTTINKEFIYAGIEQVFAKTPLLIEPDKCYGIISSFASKMAQEKAAVIIKEGEAFLAANAQRPEVKTTASGLQYEVMKEGTGIKPTAQDIFVCHYRGTLTDGTEFESSYNRNEPLEYGVWQVIKGWTEGLQLMAAGSKYKFFIPYQLGYGLNGSPPTIPGGAALIFEIELLEVKKR